MVLRERTRRQKRRLVNKSQEKKKRGEAANRDERRRDQIRFTIGGLAWQFVPRRDRFFAAENGRREADRAQRSITPNDKLASS